MAILEGNATLTGVATLSPGATVYYRAGSTITGVGTLVPRAKIYYHAGSTITGVATVVPRAKVYYGAGATLTAVGTVVLAPKVYGKLYSTLTGRAYLVNTSEVYRTVINPVLAGDLIDPTDVSKLRLTVNGSVLNLANPYYNIADLRVGYEGKYLTFSEIATPTLGSPTWAPEQVVQLELDFGSGFKTYFKGKLKNRRHVGENNNEAVEYEAMGYQTVANDVTLLNTNGLPDVLFTVGSTITSGSTVATIFTKSVATAIQDIFTLASTYLGAAGIPATIGSPGLEKFQAYLPETVQLRNLGFFAALLTLAQNEPGVKPFFDDVTQSWIFPNLLQQPTLQLDVRSVNLLNLNYEQNTADRFTAIKLYSDPNLNALVTHDNTLSLGGKRGTVQMQTATLENFWMTELEPNWDIFKEFSDSPNSSEDEPNYYWVYRRFKIPDGVEIEPGTPYSVRQKVPIKGLTEAGSPTNVGEKWVKVQRPKINLRRRLVVTPPIYNDGNPYVTGDVYRNSGGPQQVVLAYWPRGVFSFTYASSVNSDGTVATTAHTLTTEQYLATLRYPDSGYLGTAYDMFNIQREKVEIVGPTEVTTANAAAKLAVLKDVKISGELPIDGDPLEYAINLQARIRVLHPALATGLSSVSAWLTNYRYQFGKRGQSTLSLNTDITGLVKV